MARKPQPRVSAGPASASVPCSTTTSRRRGLLLVLSGPSGVGKTTLADLLLDGQRGTEGTLRRVVSATTRPRQPGEEEGRDYHFVSPDEFAAMVARSEMLETAALYGHDYGTPRAGVEAELNSGADVLLVLDAKGREQLAATHAADLVSVFLLPPDLLELERRLRARGRDEESAITRRLQAARDEMGHGTGYEYILLNQALDLTLHTLNTILKAERLRRQPPALPADRHPGDAQQS